MSIWQGLYIGLCSWGFCGHRSCRVCGFRVVKEEVAQEMPCVLWWRMKSKADWIQRNFTMENLWRAWDGDSRTILVHLDLLTTLTMVSFYTSFGEWGGIDLQWLFSFLCSWFQSILVIGEQRLSSRFLKCETWSSLSLIFFDICMKPVSEVIWKHGV